MKEWSEKVSEWWRSTAHHSPMVESRTRSSLDSHKLKFILALILGLGAGLVGPYGTYLTFSFPFRIIYWLMTTLVAFGVWEIFERFLARLMRFRLSTVRPAIIIFPFALTNSAIIILLHKLISQLGGRPIPVTWVDLVISHLVLSFLIIWPAIFIVQRMRLRIEREAGSEAISFLTEKLPNKLRGTKPFALSAEGHYVRVYTERGEALVTMRFEDAVRSVVGINGTRVHRSWWVALDHIVSLKTVGSAYEARLKSGLTIPVSRRRKADLKETLVLKNQ